MSDTSVDNYLRSSKELVRLGKKADKLIALQRVYETIAPPHLASCGQVVNLKSGKVVVLASNGAAAAKLRQIAPSLTDGFVSSGLEVTGVEVRVQVARHEAVAVEEARTRMLGARTRKQLYDLSEQLPESSPLRTALERLLRRT
jgi:hypothetical protein